MDKYKIIIVDDEPPARMKLINFIEKIPQLDLKGDFADPFDALNYLNNNHDCIVLLDINMEGMNGFELIENLKSQPNIIITSAHEEYALKGFEFNVTDYLLKPFSFDRFRKSIEKAIFNINLTNKQLGRNSEKEQYLSVKSEYKTEMIPLDSIVFIEGMKDYIRIHTIDKKIMTLKSMTAIEKELPHNDFIRIHKSFIISLRKSEIIEKDFVICQGNKIPIGKSYKKQLQQKLSEL